MEHTVTTFFLEMLDPSDLKFKPSPDPDFRIMECTLKQFQYNRFLYRLVGRDWRWAHRDPWTQEQWLQYAENENLRTWAACIAGSPAGYYELQHQTQGNIEIASFGLAGPFLGKGLGAHLLSHAIRSAWDWDAKRVWVHTCTDDHPNALPNYLARGMKIYKKESKNKNNEPTS